ncbi:putative ankyrin repeat-containing protein-like [Capsicum annuum]|nr:putative ankyrin repeat-containing protein-like [Capsicum annuum]KAF3675227.1 putative ankyrin repeat-containing protein-like [Capsicum annuum]
MEATLYNAAMRGNIGDGNFLFADHLKRNEENGYQVTPKGNTVLHVTSLYGNSNFVAKVLKITPALLCYQNKKNETTLHISANEGHTEVVHVLFARIEDHNTKEKLTRMTGTSGYTTLYKAVRSQHLDVVKILVKKDPEFKFPPNNAQEMPLYVAAESGFHDALINILEFGKKPIYVAGLEDVVSDMLGWKKSLVYLSPGSENDWTTAIHIAASEGDVNNNNQNDLHVVVLNNQDKVVHFLLDSNKCDNLVNEPDSDGNTPLYLVVVSGNHVPELIKHSRVKPMSFIK